MANEYRLDELENMVTALNEFERAVLEISHGHPAQECEPGLDYALMDYCEYNLSGGYDV